MRVPTGVLNASSQPLSDAESSSDGPLIERHRFGAGDAIILAAVVALAAGYAIAVQTAMDRRFFVAPVGNDVWFEADMPAVADNILHRWSDQRRNARHPLLP